MDELAQLEAQASACIQQQDYESARRFLDQARVVVESTHDQAKQAQVFNNLGFVCSALGDLDAAQTYLARALTIYREAGSVDSPDLAITLQHVGRLAQRRGDNQRAWGYWVEELAIWKRLESSDHIPHLATCLHACGEIMADDGEYTLARQNFEQALALREQTLPPGHADITESLADLGRLCATQGDAKAARRYLQRALPFYVSAFGPDHPAVQELQTILARVEPRGGLFNRFRKKPPDK
jgi:tetratricopeptide (TPR) repeat protein